MHTDFVGLGKALLARVASNAAKPCAANCGLKSPGIICSDCGAPMCINHAVVTASFPPSALCAPCNLRAWKGK